MQMFELKSGDLLFVQPSAEKFSYLIAASTKYNPVKTEYTHVGLVARKNKNYFVLHADQKRGCIRQSLAAFVADQSKQAIDVYRLADTQIDFTQVIARAEALLNQPYNHSFIKEQPGYYCSEFICEAFKESKVFHEVPMKFGPADTILPAWQKYYQKLDLPVPVGQLGSSPNSLIQQATVNKLKYLGHLKAADFYS